MGQKVNPLGFRLKIRQNYLSKWYSLKHNYKLLNFEDYYIRLKLNNFLFNKLTFADIQIFRINNFNIHLQPIILINLSILYPKFNILKFINLKKIKKKVQKYYIIFLIKKQLKQFIYYFFNKTKKQYFFNVILIKNQFINAMLIAKFISFQLKQRIPFRRIISIIFQNIKKIILKGIKIQLSGRLNGIEIARREWQLYKQVPLHTLIANIDYISYPVKTIYGLIGIKIWLYQK